MADPEQEMRRYARMAEELEDEVARLRAENQRLEELYESAHESCGVFEAENERLSLMLHDTQLALQECRGRVE